MSHTPLTVRIVHEYIVEHTGQQPHRFVQTRVEFGPEAITTGLLDRVTGNALKVLIALANHSRPLVGPDLDNAISLGLANRSDAGRLFTYVTDLGLADELGLHRTTVATAVKQWEEEGLLQSCLTPKGQTLRSAAGRYTAQRVILITPEAGHSQSIPLSNRVEKTDTVHPIPTTVSKKPTRYGVGKIDTKYVVDVDDETKINQLISLFTALTRQPDYKPSQRDLAALASLLLDGFTETQIRAGIQHAVTQAQQRGVAPRRVTYCIPAVREMHSGQPVSTVRNAASRWDSTPQVAPSNEPAFAINAVESVPSETRNLYAKLQQLAKTRALFLDKPQLLDLARLAIDYHETAALRGKTGLEWVSAAMCLVDSHVDTPSRYVRGILNRWGALQPTESHHHNGAHTARGGNGSDIEHSSIALPSGDQIDSMTFAAPVIFHHPPPLWEEPFWIELALQMPKATFETWLADARLFCPDEHTVIIRVASNSAKAWLEAQLRPTIERTVRSVAGNAREVEFQTMAEYSKAHASTDVTKTNSDQGERSQLI